MLGSNRRRPRHAGPSTADLTGGRRAQKARFGGELFPNVTELGSGLVFADFFQNDRETGRKGIVVIDLTEITDITVGGWT
jgi:hypothetical protein